MKRFASAIEYAKDANNIRVQLNAGVFFVHVPKNAGTALSKAMYGKQLRHYSVREYLDLGLRSDQVPIVALYRDPIERFLSAYRFLSGNGTLEVSVDPHQRPPEDVLSSADSLALWIAEKNVDVLHPGLKTQSFYVRDYQASLKSVTIFSAGDWSGLVRFLETNSNLDDRKLEAIKSLGGRRVNESVHSASRSSLSDEALAIVTTKYFCDFSIRDNLTDE